MIIISSFSNSYGGEDGKTKWGFSFSIGPNADLFHDQPDHRNLFEFGKRLVAEMGISLPTYI